MWWCRRDFGTHHAAYRALGAHVLQPIRTPRTAPRTASRPLTVISFLSTSRTPRRTTCRGRAAVALAALLRCARRLGRPLARRARAPRRRPASPAKPASLSGCAERARCQCERERRQHGEQLERPRSPSTGWTAHPRPATRSDYVNEADENRCSARRLSWRRRTGTSRWCGSCSRTSNKSAADGATALKVASQKGHVEVLQLLLARLQGQQDRAE
jgi:hypothetical protein